VTVGVVLFLLALSGKYLDATEKVDGRLHNHYGHMVHLLRQEVDDAVFAHKMAADKRFIPLHAWALNYCITRPWVTSTCIGARNLDQLNDAILSQNVRIPEIPYADEDIELVSFPRRAGVVRL
jgi:aryl-alcohol dehydrogenase-like predicted oxidoreductase